MLFPDVRVCRDFFDLYCPGVPTVCVNSVDKKISPGGAVSSLKWCSLIGDWMFGLLRAGVWSSSPGGSGEAGHGCFLETGLVSELVFVYCLFFMYIMM